MHKTYFKTNKPKIKITTADKWFSKYIRIRDSYSNGFVCCCTCGKPMHWKNVHAGHFVTRDKLSTRFNEKNANAQCPKCNCDGKGEQAKHAIYIDRKYGSGTAESLIELGGIRCKADKVWWKEVAKEFRLKTKAIAKKKGIEI
jgi:hypothetical protein